MHFPVFSRNSNPAVDKPLIRKSKSYVLDLLARGEAAMVSGDLRDGVHLRNSRHRSPLEIRNLQSALNDWVIRHSSRLSYSETLMITTEQLDTR